MTLGSLRGRLRWLSVDELVGLRDVGEGARRPDAGRHHAGQPDRQAATDGAPAVGPACRAERRRGRGQRPARRRRHDDLLHDPVAGRPDQPGRSPARPPPRPSRAPGRARRRRAACRRQHAEQPLPVRTVALQIAEWVGRLGRGLGRGPGHPAEPRGTGTVFLTLRDPVADVQLSVTCPARVCEAVVPPLARATGSSCTPSPEVYLARGSLSLVAHEIRPVGVGELLARLEQLKGVLAARGCSTADARGRCRSCPRTVGLVTGRASAAERDVLENARRRWPAVRFDVRAVAVQGCTAVEQVIDAVRALDRDRRSTSSSSPVAAGRVEDLLPFSDEALCRAVAACRTPVVSAIGHEPDVPLLDLVADVRAVDPHRRGQAGGARRRGGGSPRSARCATGAAVPARAGRRGGPGLAALRSRPVLADPQVLVGRQADEVLGAARPGPAVRRRRLATAGADLGHRAPRCGRCRPPRRSTGGTRCCSTPTGGSSATRCRWLRPASGWRAAGSTSRRGAAVSPAA